MCQIKLFQKLEKCFVFDNMNLLILYSLKNILNYHIPSNCEVLILFKYSIKNKQQM